uniref:Bardet-Biedl syndrome 1 N-terminal domain-containing protein n=1 Tax=Callorhinchus milii TaxID=7868 RepID=A0A4W3H7J0_CALMI
MWLFFKENDHDIRIREPRRVTRRRGETSPSASSGGVTACVNEANAKWLDAYYDPVANLYTFTSCVALSDLHGDGDNKLVLGDLGTGLYNMKLKVYRGTGLVCENALIDLPTGVVAFLMDTSEPRTPALAVASGPYIYIYKNMRPYFKFTLPVLPVNALEEEVWHQAKEILAPRTPITHPVTSRATLTRLAHLPRTSRAGA